MAYNKLSLEEKLLTKAKQVGDCLVWVGHKCPKGYGLLRLDGHQQRAHRLMYELHHGPIPEGLIVMHSCDTPACINIAHLSAGTQLANVQDMHNKGRARYLTGENHPQSKLTTEQVVEIRQRYVRYSHTDGARPLARDFGVSKASIQAIVEGVTWKPSAAI